jgi:hypothetical protein
VDIDEWSIPDIDGLSRRLGHCVPKIVFLGVAGYLTVVAGESVESSKSHPPST